MDGLRCFAWRWTNEDIVKWDKVEKKVNVSYAVLFTLRLHGDGCGGNRYRTSCLSSIITKPSWAYHKVRHKLQHHSCEHSRVGTFEPQLYCMMCSPSSTTEPSLYMTSVSPLTVYSSKQCFHKTSHKGKLEIEQGAWLGLSLDCLGSHLSGSEFELHTNPSNMMKIPLICLEARTAFPE